MQRQQDDPTWEGLISEIVDERIERSEATELEFDGFETRVPLEFGPDAERATWRLDGTVTVTVDGDRRPLAEWLRFWAQYTDES